MFPRARREGLLVKEMDEDLVVVDLDRNLAHSLNGIAARIWLASDGSTPVEDIAAQLDIGVSETTARELCEHALDLLQRAHLLSVRDGEPERCEPTSRRRWLRTSGLVAASLVPALVALTLPSPARACSAPPPSAQPNDPRWRKR